MSYFNIYEAEVLKFSDSLLVKLSQLCDEIDSFIKEELPNQLSLTGDVFQIVVKLENYIKSLFNKKLGLIVEFVKNDNPNYIRRIIPANKPKMLLNRRLSLDLVKIAKNNLPIKSVKDQLLKEVKNITSSLSSGKEPFAENLNVSYIMFEIEGSSAEAGTLASFKGALPVEPVALVDTDGDEKNLIAKEIKKDHFILKPTKEQLKRAILRNIATLKLSEFQIKRYNDLIKSGNIKILKSHLSENQDTLYKKFSNKITISKIYYR